MVPFVKGQGLGNDYVVVDAADLPGGRLTAAGAVALCDRHRGVGADGVLVRVPSVRADFGVRIWNPDGSEAEKSGNGLRIFAKWLRDHGHAREPDFTVETPGGLVACACRPRRGRVEVVSVEMGRASFKASAVPFLGFDGDAVGVPLVIPDGPTLVVTAVSVGNPHCVVFDGDVSAARCRVLGPLLERHPRFPRRTNVQLARATARDAIAIEIWERGAGYTQASGSSSCAAAAAAVRTRRCDPGPIRVAMPGGTLVVTVRVDWSLRLEGPVEEAFTGVLAASLADALR